jgi:DNA (cytosine-5)-methyltransferase 1
MGAIKYGSVCSGVEAATVAWHHLGWEPRWFSEIEKFPSAVLAHHYPDTPNHGDMTTFKEWPNDPIDLLVGGTPCQSFSVAGLRKGLDDPRGNLMLTYLAIAERYQPRWLVWENVPGVLSSNRGRDFGTFLGALGQIGYGFAYRVLDAQYFGVAQRRRRVFVVGYLGDWRRAAAVLFERESLSGHPAPSREAGKNLAADAGTGAGRGSHWDALTNPHPSLNQSHNTGGIGASNQELFSQRESGIVPQTGYRMVAFGEYADDNTASAMKARDYKDATDLAVCATGDIAHTLKGEGHDGSEDGTGRGVPTIAHTVALRGRDGGNPPAVAHTLGTQCSSATEDGTGRGSPLVPSLMAVRRLTPVECERLQGFPDDYTLVPHRNKPAADGPRYKSLGNSMAVPVMRWIGERISKVESYDK